MHTYTYIYLSIYLSIYPSIYLSIYMGGGYHGHVALGNIDEGHAGGCEDFEHFSLVHHEHLREREGVCERETGTERESERERESPWSPPRTLCARERERERESAEHFSLVHHEHLIGRQILGYMERGIQTPKAQGRSSQNI